LWIIRKMFLIAPSTMFPRGGEGCRPKAPVMERGPAGGGGNQLQGFRGAGARDDIPSIAEKGTSPKRLGLFEGDIHD
jgi:hypothetical protein